MADEANDVKTNASSSETFATASDVAADAKQQSTSSDAQTGSKADEKQQTLLDAVREHVGEEKTDKTLTSEDHAAEETDSKNESDKGKEEKTGDEKEDVTGEQETETEKGPIPYERFEEVVSERNTFKTELEGVKPKVETFDKLNDFCQRNQISSEQFEQHMKLVALMNTNPAEALKVLTPLLDSLQGMTGDRLPEDLQKAVDNQEISVDLAKKWAKDRAEKNLGGKRFEVEQRTLEQRQIEMQQREMATQTQAWEKSKRDSDPDYKPKAKPSDPDGKWEDVADKFIALLHKVNEKGEFVNPVRTTADMVALMEKAYNLVNTRIGKAKPLTRKALSSNGSSSATTKKDIADYKTLSEYVADTVK